MKKKWGMLGLRRWREAESITYHRIEDLFGHIRTIINYKSIVSAALQKIKNLKERINLYLTSESKALFGHGRSVAEYNRICLHVVASSCAQHHHFRCRTLLEKNAQGIINWENAQLNMMDIICCKIMHKELLLGKMRNWIWWMMLHKNKVDWINVYYREYKSRAFESETSIY